MRTPDDPGTPGAEEAPSVLKLVELREVSDFCPTQWVGRTEDGQHIYFRYRWGGWGLGIGDTEDEALMRRQWAGTAGPAMSGVCTLHEWIEWVRAAGPPVVVACAPQYLITGA
jgi:hypothetical protein